ncbi:glycosyltransferase family 2 protein [Winogradskyella ouciana]|uniref:glycosyltransferase family 2 protein n=1 Tax=Winogradskyella ouciana TaxID=2608631 RepID=UPI003D279B8A
MSFFSVVITVYNKADFIKNTLNSVLNQSFKDFEIIVVNDGSTDESEAIINSFNDTRIRLITTKNQGASVARNTGIKVAKYNYIALLDGDDIWDKEYLKTIHTANLKFPEHKIFATAIAQKYEHKTVPVSYNFKQSELYMSYNYFEASQKYSLLTSSSVVFKKSILEKTGYFDPLIISGQDTDMWIRFGLHYDILFINKQLVIYNYSPSSLSNTTFGLDKKPKYDKYLKKEQNNKYIKAYLDRNRYSMAILSKLQSDNKSFNYYKSHIDINTLSTRKNLLLISPKWLLKLLIKLKSLKGEKVYYPKD